MKIEKLLFQHGAAGRDHDCGVSGADRMRICAGACACEHVHNDPDCDRAGRHLDAREKGEAVWEI